MKLAATLRSCLVRGVAAGASIALACSVFPEQVRLPNPLGAGGEAGEPPAASGGVADTGGAFGAGGSGALGGVTGEGGSGAVALAGGGQAGEPGAAGAGPGCAAPVVQELIATADTWIDAGDEGANHGSEPQLHVSGGAAPRRALFSFSWPSVSSVPGTLRVRLALRLLENEDVNADQRSFAVHVLGPEFEETKTDWAHRGPGNPRLWSVPGGDFAAASVSPTLPAGTAPGAVAIDVTELLSPLASSARAVGLIVLETGVVPAPPADLIVAAREGAAADAPRLVVEYCEP